MLIGLEGEGLERLHKRGLFGRRQDVGPVVEPRHDRRADGHVAEQVDLRGSGHDRASRSIAAPVVSRLDRLTPTSRTPRAGG